jgi:uncharacterized protein (TIGR02246 family)
MIMKRLAILAALALAVPAVASAHVGVRPRESKAGAEERYTVRVPTEGQVVTTSVELEIPDGVTVIDVPAAADAKHELKRQGERVVAIIWTKEIKPRESAEFVFVAKNPAAGSEIVWKAHQRYADGTASDWVNPPGQRSPAPITKLVPVSTAADAQAGSGGDAAAIDAWLNQYDAAFLAKDLEKLATFYHPDVTIFEGGGVNNGWIDYRDRHLGPELKRFENLQYSHSNRKVHVLGDGRTAYVTSNYAIKARMGDRDLDSGGLETLVLVKGADSAWKIRHSHTSARPRRPAG